MKWQRRDIMSLLSDALEEIIKWEEKYFLGKVSLLHPSLSDFEIDKITSNWQVKLPQEIRELYKWRNGSGDGSTDIFRCIFLFEGFAFFPLQSLSVKHHPGTEEDRWKLIFKLLELSN